MIDLDDLAAHGDMERKRKREDAMFPAKPPPSPMELAKFIIAEWAAFECEPDPIMEGDAVNALILARALVAAPEGTPLTPFGEALDLLETCQHNDPDTRYEAAIGVYKDPDNPSDVRLRDVVKAFLKRHAPQPQRPVTEGE